ncbi:amidase [Amphritea sp.]|uniref:amidase n=1 Tax=Amphritea sp. TaxID=1872502 RepID=UPI003A90B111
MPIFSQRVSLGDGLRVAVKDSIDIEGLPTRCGSRALEHALPASQHADVVAMLLQSGCQIVGKTTLHELAYGMTGLNQWGGTPVNFRYPDLIPGGSSSGSAVAVAAAEADFSIGTDTGGSIRVPAACCGVFGFKPTFGRLSRRGVMPEQSSLDCVGVLADSADMLITAMQAIEPGFKTAPLSGDIRLGVIEVVADEAIDACISACLQRTPFQLQPLTLAAFNDAFTAGMVLINAETWHACGHLLDTGKVGDDVAARLAQAAHTTDQQVAAAESIRTQFSQQVDAALAQVTALVLPTLPAFPMSLADAQAGKTDLSISTFVRPFNLSGHPAISIPLQTSDQRPVGLQLVGRKGDDERLCELARLLSEFMPNQNNNRVEF